MTLRHCCLAPEYMKRLCVCSLSFIFPLHYHQKEMQCAVMEKKNSKQPQLNFIIGCYKNQVQKLCLTLCIMLDKTAACFCELLLMAS